MNKGTRVITLDSSGTRKAIVSGTSSYAKTDRRVTAAAEGIRGISRA